MRSYGDKDYMFWQAVIDEGPIIVPDPYVQDQNVEINACWDGEADT